jgi:D-threonate/D-erythronate kinase
MIGVIADDLTGAAEIGAIGLRHGLRAEIIFGNKPGGDADLVCVDTDSRSQTAAEAARRTAAAAKLLKNCGAQWIYKKVDSMLRGHVTMEIEAAMKQLGFERCVLAPANPSLRRTIFGGNYFVRGKPIHKTEFARDPQFPRRSSRVMELVKLPPGFSISVRELREGLPERGIAIAEAATTGDVAKWAKVLNEGIFPAGGAEFFDVLLTLKELRGGFQTPGAPAMNDTSREFFVSGAVTAMARKFVAEAKQKKQPVFSLPKELGWGNDLAPAAAEAVGRRIAEAFDSHLRVVLTVGLPRVTNPKVSEKLSDHVAQIAVRALRHADVAYVFSEGGATSAALVRRMKWSRLTVLREHAPGVATLLADEGKKIFLTIKPGSYPWPSGFTGN